jgi:hypothetical protein
VRFPMLGLVHRQHKTNEQQVLEAIRRANGGRWLPSLVQLTGLTSQQVQNALTALSRQGKIDSYWVDHDSWRVVVYTLPGEKPVSVSNASKVLM